jgi:hypothetical protein
MPEDDQNAAGGQKGADNATAKDTVNAGRDPKEWTADFSNPIVVLAMLILLSLFVMIGASIFGIDHGFLAGMAKTDLARGLITYLFAVVTIGIAVALVLSTLVGPEPIDKNDGRFQRGKEVLSLLLGVFGTIVGFYFGSETSSSAKETPYQLSSIDISPQPVEPAGQITVRAVVKGGNSPIRFGVGQSSDTIEIKDLVLDGGWIVKPLQLKPAKPGENQTIRLLVEDAQGKRLEQVAPIRRSAQNQQPQAAPDKSKGTARRQSAAH